MADDEEKDEIPEEEEVEGEKEEQVLAELDGITVKIPKDQAKLIYEKGYYGRLEEDGTLKLDPVEALLLRERKRIQVFDKAGKEYDFPSLVDKYVEQIPQLWVKYLCYKDLRSRGYIVRGGYGNNIDYRIYDRGAQIGVDAAKYFVHTVIEGTPLELSSLDEITKIAKSNRKKLVLAVVDRIGEVTFYNAQEVDL
ncbi:MAG: tRNA-intron lyase [Promethearchaeota archaeon]|nr:MAG: tRNA-intron lyase [Candidatus Lokiarchaeota archaeon]